MDSSSVINVTSVNWKKDVLEAKVPVVVEFYTPTCPHCRQLTPIFQRLAGEYNGKMVFAMVDASAQSDIASGYGVMGVPTLKFFCAGRPIYEIVGSRSDGELREEFGKVLSIHQRCVFQSSPIYA